MTDNPYVGARSFTRQERDLFFGRDLEARDLLSLVLSERLVLFYAQSGAGKSSLVNTHLIPDLEGQGFFVLPVARVGLELPPDTQAQNVFVHSLLESVDSQTEGQAPRIAPELTLARYLRLYGGEGEEPPQAGAEQVQIQPQALIIDQFEELFTAHPEAWQQREHFFVQLRDAMQDDPQLWVVLALREELLAALEPYAHLVPGRLRARFYMQRLGAAAALKAIQEPAARYERPFQHDAATTLVNSLRRMPGSSEAAPRIGQFVEPVQLQVVCHRLWEQIRDVKPLDGITKDHVEKAGDVNQALTDFYTETLKTVVSQTGISERRLRAWFDEKLITPSGNRGLVHRDKTETERLPNTAVDLLRAAYVIRPIVRGDDTWYELGHDRLVEPVRRNNTIWFKAHLSLLERQAALWLQQGRPSGLLLRERELADAVKWAQAHEDELTPEETGFLRACQEAEERERRAARMARRFTVGMALLALLAMAVAFFAVRQFTFAEARRISNEAEDAIEDKNFRLAALLAIESRRLMPQNNSVADEVLTDLLFEPRAGGNAYKGHNYQVNSVAWSTDKRLASGSDDRTVIVWDLEARKPAQTLRGDFERVTSVAWSADGRLASGSSDNTVIVWDLQTGQPAQMLGGHAGPVYSVAWSVDGRLASGSDDGTVIVWNLSGTDQESALNAGLESGELISQTLEGHSSPVRSVAWSVDGRLASGSANGRVIVWDLSGTDQGSALNVGLESAQPAQMLEGHSGPVYSVAWSVDGRLASGSHDNTVIVWDLEARKPAQTLRGHSNRITSVAWSADGRLASGSVDDTVIVWDLQSGEPDQTLDGHSEPVRSVNWSVDGRLASGSTDEAVIVWNLQTGEPAQTLSCPHGPALSVAWSADGHLASGSEDETVMVWDLEDGESGQTLEGHFAAVKSVAWSADGRLASGSDDRTVIIWDLGAGEPTRTLVRHSGGVESVAWSADGRLASASCGKSDDDQCTQGQIILWDPAPGRPVQTLLGHSGKITSLAWSVDGRLASGAADGTAIVWGLQNGEPISHTLEGHSWGVTSVAWSRDGTRLASGSCGRKKLGLETGDDCLQGEIILWDLAAGRPDKTLRGHSSYVTSLAWSPDTKQVATASCGKVDDGDCKQGEIILWDLARGKPARTLRVHSGKVTSVAWSVDGHLASGSEDRKINVYPPIQPECNWLMANLDEEEWTRYIGYAFVHQPTCPGKPKQVINSPLLLVQGRLLLAALVVVPAIPGLSLSFLRGDSIAKRISRGAVFGVLVGYVGTSISIVLAGGFLGILDLFTDIRSYTLPFAIIAIISAVVNAFGKTIARPGRLASQVFWGGWVGFALLGLVVGVLIEGIYISVAVAVVLGSVGGVLAAVATRIFIKEEELDPPKVRSGLRGAVFGAFVGGLMGLAIYTGEYTTFAWAVWVPILVAVNAISAAIVRPGKTASVILVLGGISFALLDWGLLVFGDLRYFAEMGPLLAPAVFGSGGGLLAAIATRMLVQDGKPDPLKARLLRGAVFGAFLGLAWIGPWTWAFMLALAVVNAISVALVRSGRIASRVFWGGWIGFALFAGLLSGVLSQDISIGVAFAGIVGTVGGLLAAILGQVSIKERKPDALNVG